MSGCNDPLCNEVYEALFELLNESVSVARRAELTAHIEACPECFTRLGIEREVTSIVRKSCCVSAPQGLKDKVMLRISVENTVIRRERD